MCSTFLVYQGFPGILLPKETQKFLINSGMMVEKMVELFCKLTPYNRKKYKVASYFSAVGHLLPHRRHEISFLIPKSRPLEPESSYCAI